MKIEAACSFEMFVALFCPENGGSKFLGSVVNSLNTEDRCSSFSEMLVALFFTENGGR
jgi:hypothetical protein